MTPANLEDFLGKPRFQDESLFQKKVPGVVMGLAWTSMGGATLYVESSMKPSKAKGFKQTGQLGDVMKESSEIAYTYISSRSKEFGFPEDLFETHFVHLHVPAGRHSQGRSIGGHYHGDVAVFAGKKKAAQKERGHDGRAHHHRKVLPIGGVKEKTLGAKRANVKTIIFPLENKKDFDELPDHVRKGIEAASLIISRMCWISLFK